MRKSTPLLHRNILSQVIARHGDRAPAINLASNSPHEENEMKKWLTRLPPTRELKVRVMIIHLTLDFTERKNCSYMH
jgi:hypothetical protein